ncbi:MAG: GIY-YIG nuclease family protein [Candidatus Pacebacteria bacterium]|nr:GIY-YIG nuclease family protein [Candidatus Paceibacterota bacterium]
MNLKQAKDKLKQVPKAAGVYNFLDDKKEVLYVGRAINLQNRLKQYFQKNIDSRISEMVNTANDFIFIATKTLLEAVILEAEQIKKYWPKYNIVDRDDRSFSYLMISKTDNYPKPIIIRGRELKKFSPKNVWIFGPYQSQFVLHQALKIARRIFPYSTCEPNSGQPCFEYQIGLCPGTCLGKLSPQEYKENIKKLALLFQGNKQKLFKLLKQDNPEKIKALENLQEVALLQKEKDLSQPILERIEGYDISHLSAKEAFASLVVATNGEIDKSEYRLFKISEKNSGDDLRSLQEALERRLKHTEWPYPNLIFIDGGKPQIDFIANYFDRNNIRIPVVGLSKYGGDKLVFPKNTPRNIKLLISSLKPDLQKLREEAHRFSLSASRRRRRLNVK